MPTPAWRKRTYANPIDKQWTSGDSVQLAIGQGDLLGHAAADDALLRARRERRQARQSASRRGRRAAGRLARGGAGGACAASSRRRPVSVGLPDSAIQVRAGGPLRGDPRALRDGVRDLRRLRGVRRRQDRDGREVRPAAAGIPRAGRLGSPAARPGVVLRLRADRRRRRAHHRPPPPRRLRHDRERRPRRRGRGARGARGLRRVLGRGCRRSSTERCTRTDGHPSQRPERPLGRVAPRARHRDRRVPAPASTTSCSPRSPASSPTGSGSSRR